MNIIPTSTASRSNKSQIDRKFVAVAGIDFGTSRSGYCFAFVKDPDRLYDDQNFGSESRNLKTKTALLLKRVKGELVFDSFGFKAEAKYASGDLEDEDEDESSDEDEEGAEATSSDPEGVVDGQKLPSYEYFDRIKMNLSEDSARKILVSSTTGFKVPIENIIAECIRHLKEKILTELNQASSLDSSSSSNISPTDVLWVLTVPAIWGNAAKQRMRIAAEMAGLAKKNEYHHLVLALEPEAASIESRYFARSVGQDLKPGDKFCIIDCGGGTSDILAFEVKTCMDSDFTMKELMKPSGGPWGSTYIDNNFLDFLKSLVGEKLLSEFAASHPADFLSLRNAFISRKENFTPSDDPSDKITIKCPILSGFLKTNNTTLKACVDIYNNIHETDIKCSKDTRLRLPYSVMMNFYVPIMNATIQHVKNLIATQKSLRGLKYLFLVGGFGESKVLQKAVKDAFESPNLAVIFPVSSDLVVVRGAVRYGLSPSIIISRKSPLTYGFATTRLFDPAKHPLRLRFTTSTGEERCDNIFSPLILADDDVPVGYTISKSLLPIDAAQEYLTLIFYASESRNVRFTDEPGVKQIGKLRLRMTDTDRDIRSRKVKVEIVWGKTEIEVYARNVFTGHVVEGTLDFLVD